MTCQAVKYHLQQFPSQLVANQDHYAYQQKLEQERQEALKAQQRRRELEAEERKRIEEHKRRGAEELERLRLLKLRSVLFVHPCSSLFVALVFVVLARNTGAGGLRDWSVRNCPSSGMLLGFQLCT